MEQQLIDALQETIKAQKVLIDYLKAEVERLKSNQLPLSPFTPILPPNPNPQPFVPQSPYQPLNPLQPPYIVTSGSTNSGTITTENNPNILTGDPGFTVGMDGNTSVSDLNSIYSYKQFNV